MEEERNSPPVSTTGTTSTEPLRSEETTVIITAEEELAHVPSCEENECDNTIHGFNMSNVTVIEKLDVNPTESDTSSCRGCESKVSPTKHEVYSSDCTNTSPQNNNDLVLSSLLTVNSKVCDLDSSANSKISDLDLSLTSKGCEGSDSGVEVLENVIGDCDGLKRTLSSNSGNYLEFGSVTPARSCDSSIISCCSNYEEAYNILARRNSTLLEDYNLRSGDGTSENGSESSSLSRSSSKASRTKPSSVNSKRKITSPETKCQQLRSRNIATNSSGVQKPSERFKASSTKASNSSTPARTRPLPPKLSLSSKKDTKSLARNVTPSKVPNTSPNDDGRWPSVNSKPAPLMGRTVKPVETPKARLISDSAYATFPRRRKDKDNKDTPRPNIKESNTNRLPLVRRQSYREGTPLRSLPPYPKRKTVPKTKIYHEISVQTALTNDDIEKAFAGVTIRPCRPQDAEVCEAEVQVEIMDVKAKRIQEQYHDLNAKYEKLFKDYEEQKERLCETERRLKEEKIEKEGLKEELKHNTERVLAILGNDVAHQSDENTSSDSLVALESHYRKVSEIAIKQENEISELNAYCRTLQRELDKSVATQHTLMQHLQEMESETKELQEFMQAEKNTLSDALKETETEIKSLNATISKKEKELESKQEECKQLARLSEQRRLDIVDLQSRLSALETNYKDILVQGSKISSAAIALSLLISRLDNLNQELVKSYNISEQELEDVIFHNEAYTNSSSNSPELTPEKQKNFDQEDSLGSATSRASSFVSAIINAIKNAAAQSLFSIYYRDVGSDSINTETHNASEILDLETEPCLMMEPVLEDVILPDTHSQNLVSTSSLANSIRLTRSESLNNLSSSFTPRQFSVQHSFDNVDSMNTSLISNSSSYSEIGSTSSLLDQVILLDNLVTKLLKILRIIQMENEETQNELQEERDNLVEQTEKQKEGNKIIAKQLKDWEILGSKLKVEVRDLTQEVGKKNVEIQNLKIENDRFKREIETLSEDVCTLSTLCSKYHIVTTPTENGSSKCIDTAGKLEGAGTSNEVKVLEEKLSAKEKQLKEVMDEYVASKQVLAENFKVAIDEAKRQYKAIDNALETLHSIQTVVQECPQLAKLQSELEDLNFQTVSSKPLPAPSEYNSNPTVVKAVAELEIPSPINSTA